MVEGQMSMEELKVEYGKLQIFERQGEEGVWSVERVTEDGDIEQALFMGPDAEKRAREYAAFKYGV